VNATPLAIPDVVLLEPKVYEDSRGHFYESYNARTFAAAVGHDVAFVQDNHSLSQRGVIRGLHYQLAPAPQGKLVRVIAGEIFDVAVDIRRSSPTFGKWVGETLSAANKRQLWIPIGFAHCFMALSDNTEVLYKATDFYHRAAEQSIRWDDPTLAIAWPKSATPILSDKDVIAPSFADAITFD
jgi:dTDP-4-dehydrorhamnose 3,5-epimerase